MYIRIALATLLLGCAGCTQDSTPSSGEKNQRGASTASVAAASAAPLHAPRNRSFANFPDRGDLVAYPAQRVIRHDGAYKWHRAGLSEAHALRAVGGLMQITTPAGERLQFQYERHVEHPSGDWTWIGRAKGGAPSDEVVVTFGEEAAFGSISQPGQAPLKLTMSGGVSWLIETDRSQIAGIDNSATRPRKPDFLIPPKIKAGFGASTDIAPAALSTTGESALAAATTTVDVLLGYTSGFAAAQGGQAQAITRLNNMVEITNQAYANSQVDARVRLVHAMQVSYPDNTSNDSALEALTGFRAPSTRTTPDPAFAALRSARDQYGADLVSLVRDFTNPENEGCGIAWLIGGGQSGIDSSDEYFGYSVVSDGRDVGTDGKTYFCREETLAHELGHNMGSQHDRVTATEDGSLKYGVYPYSFGYKTAAGAGNFYTVMTYGDSGQTSYRIFSNPRSTFCGAPCGIENQADNARSLGQTIPVIARFRATSVPSSRARKDINGDARDDLIWHNSVQSRHGYWAMNGSAILGMVNLSAAGGYSVATDGDFNGDGRLDVLWTSAKRDLWLLTSNGSAFSARQIGSFPSGWAVVGSGDVNGDGTDDLVWHNAAESRYGYWLMQSGAIARIVSAAAVTGYRLAATGYFNSDRLLDLLWTNSGGDLRMWIGNGETFASTRVGTYSDGWRIFAAGDVNGDGRDDLLWRNPLQNLHGYWLMNGPAIVQMTTFSAASGYVPASARDFNGDGLVDVMWTSAAGDLQLLSSNGSAFTHSYVGSYGSGWRPIDPNVR